MYVFNKGYPLVFIGNVKWEIFFFVKSWAIVPRGTSKKKIWPRRFFGSVLTIFISFSGSVIVFSGLVIDTADSYMLQQFHNCFA